MTDFVSFIPYANMAPYRMLTPPEGVVFVPLVPSASVAALKTGQVKAAAVPVGALPSLGDAVEMLGRFGIAARTEVGSVMLFSELPLCDIRRPREIRLTAQSATSVRLLYLVLGYVNGFDAIPYVTEDPKRAVATLLIGDDALRRWKRGTDRHVTDLVTEWYRRHHKPLVFARWVVRRDASPDLKGRLLGWLNGLRDHDDEYLLKSARAEAARVGMAKDDMVAYLRGMRRVLGEEEIEGQAIFLEELRRHVPEGLFPKLPSTRRAARRIDRAECLSLLSDAPLGEVMERAHAARMARHPEGLVTYVRDTNPNYTNICTTKCRFCAFCRDAGDAEAYTLTPSALAERVRFARHSGATTVLLQGGHNPAVSLDDWRAYIRAIREACPDVHVHPFSPPEILYMARREGLTVPEVLAALKAEGVDTLPGGGAEILSNAVRRELAPKKCDADAWLGVMAAAHELGFRTTATMMFGHAERDEEIAEHLFRLREVQDRTGGFSSFIPWSFKPGNSPLSERFPVPVHPARYVRVIAVARLVLDNFDHIQSSWFSESERAGMLGLLAGADDFGGLLVEENVLKTSGYERRTTEERVQIMIRKSGFAPALRDSHYEVVNRFDGESGL